jgi:hypothetical protein
MTDALIAELRSMYYTRAVVLTVLASAWIAATTP